VNLFEKQYILNNRNKQFKKNGREDIKKLQ